jgi:hypothetical protein
MRDNSPDKLYARNLWVIENTLGRLAVALLRSGGVAVAACLTGLHRDVQGGGD